MKIRFLMILQNICMINIKREALSAFSQNILENQKSMSGKILSQAINSGFKHI